MNKRLTVLLSILLAVAGCSPEPEQAVVSEPDNSMVISGRWIVEADGSIMQDPQTSGLTVWQNQLVSISDGSADASQQRRIHLLDPLTATLAPKGADMGMANEVRRSCFSDYLQNEPDLEAIVADPAQPDVFYTVTEDATRTGALSFRCQQKYQDTGSTDYPTLLVRLQWHDSGEVTMTHVRPLQFPLELNVGNFPNDGIEGLAMGPDGVLYLGLEKDTEGQARIFSVTLDDDFWQTQDFAVVTDPQFKMPPPKPGNHPINGLAYYQPDGSERGYLLAAARNDNELWIIDSSGEEPARQLYFQFNAPTGMTAPACEPEERMDNASIEGLTVLDDTLWMVNDPWKVNYKKNIQCPANRVRYEAMAPLLFGIKIQPEWFEAP